MLEKQNIDSSKSETLHFPNVSTLMKISLGLILFTMISCVFIGILYEKNKFALVNSLPILTSLLIILSILTYGKFMIFSGLAYVALSVLVASIMQSLILMHSAPKTFWTGFPMFNKATKAIRKFVNIYWPLCFAIMIIQFTNVFYIYLNSFEDSAISWIYYAERIYYLPVTLIAIPLSTVLIPNISRLIIFKYEESISLQNQAIKYFFASLIPLTVFIYFMSEIIVRILFERGEFNQLDTIATSQALKLFLIGMPAFSLAIILRPFFAASHKSRTILISSLSSSILGLIVALLLIDSLKFLAVPVAVSTAAWVNVMLLLSFQIKANFFRLEPNILMYCFKYICFTCILGCSMYIVQNIYDNNDLLNLLLGLMTFSFSYILFVFLFDEELYSKFKSKILAILSMST